jgi:hypothetical protein
MYLRRRGISPNVTQESLRDNAAEVTPAEYAQSCTFPLEYRFAGRKTAIRPFAILACSEANDHRFAC